MSEETIKEIIKLIDKLLFEFIKPSFLPIILVWIGYHYNLKSRSKEKELDLEYNSKSELKNQEKIVYGSLSKILFDVQFLYTSLSASCIDKNCINDAIIKFDEAITKCHTEISKNLLYMPSEVINYIYEFYQEISNLKISLKEFNNENHEMAHICVYDSSIKLAEILTKIQKKISEEDKTLKEKFNETEQKIMKYCCGRKPSEKLLDKYIKLLKKTKPDLTDNEIYEINLRWKDDDGSPLAKIRND